MSSVVFVIDNRSIPIESFDIEASMSSYHRSNELLLSKFLFMSDAHNKWISKPMALFVAGSSDKAKLIGGKYLERSGISALMEVRYSCSTQSKISRSQTWGGILADSFHKLADSLKSNTLPEKKNHITVFIFSNDYSLLGSCKSIEECDESMSTFCSAVNNCTRLISVEIQIISVAITLNSCNEVEKMLQIKLKQSMPQVKIGFRTIINSTLYYEEEFRKIISRLRPIVTCQIDLPYSNGMRCSLKIDLFPTTVTSSDSLNDEMKSAELFSIVPRDGVDPITLEGLTLHVRASNQVDEFSSKKGYDNNEINFLN